MAATIWWVLGFILLAAEMASGTFYMLILGITALLTGCAAYFGLAETGQWIFAAVVASLGSIIINRYRARRPHPLNPTQDLDVGQTVRLISAAGSELRVHYRGTEWQAELLPSDIPVAENLFIHAKHGNRLLVSPEAPKR